MKTLLKQLQKIEEIEIYKEEQKYLKSVQEKVDKTKEEVKEKAYEL